MKLLAAIAVLRSVMSILLIQTILFGQPGARSFKLLPVWTERERQWRIIVVPRSSPAHIIETARFIHRRYPTLSFFLVDTERGIAQFNSSVRDPESKNFPLEWATKHYLGIASEVIHHGGNFRNYMQWELEAGNALSFPPTPLK